MGTSDDSLQHAPRGSTRETSRSRRSRSRSRSVSVSSRSSRARSRSRSRERTSRSRRSRSASPSRKSRRSHRSRSRSASRDRVGSRRGHRGHSSRHRDRDRARDRDRSSRKRSRRDRSRSRSAEGRRRSRRDSSPRDDRRQRRRHESDVESSEKATPASNTATDTAPAAFGKLQALQNDKLMKQQMNGKVDVDGEEKQDTPTSQESLATTTASIAASSQGDVEVPSKEPDAREKAFTTNESIEKPAESTTTTTKRAATAKVDVKSIKMDILKALADARSTIAGIKAAAPTATAVTDAPTTSSPVQANVPANLETTAEVMSLEEKASLPHTSEIEERLQPPLASADLVQAVSPQKKQVSAVDVDEFDMFSAAEQHGAGLPLSPAAAPAAMVLGTSIQSNYDDADGYYKPSVGEVLHGQYRVLGTVGKGVFSTVLRCQRVSSTETTTTESDIVAIKLIRNNDIMREASQTEIKILTHLSARDPRDKKHCVRLLDRFEHRNHVALVFESMQMNVREAMKKFGGKGGISIQAVRVFCKHLLVALSHLDASGIVHADIKPDNVLLDEKQTMIKLCDFGSAFESTGGKHDPTPYLVSRFYRAPEIVLGLAYDKAVDMWSVGCCLYEMFTGKVMFPGATNNEMLKLFMELKGKVPNKIIKKHRQAYIEQFQMEPHFTEDNKFCSHELDRVTGKPVLRMMDAMKTRFDLSSALLSAKSSTDDRKQVLELRNLLERMFALDASKRITPKEALAHPFVKTEGKQAT